MGSIRGLIVCTQNAHKNIKVYRRCRMGYFIVRILDSVERFLTIVADWFYEED